MLLISWLFDSIETVPMIGFNVYDFGSSLEINDGGMGKGRLPNDAEFLSP